MSEILKKITEGLLGDERVEDVGVYLHATVVKSRGMGLAYTFPRRSFDDRGDREELIAGGGKLTGLLARDLARYALSKHLAEASVGIAAINSLIEPPKERIIWRNGVDLIMEEAAGKRLAVIGHFPFVERVRPLVKALWVLELDPREGDIPAQEAPNIVPGADVVAITGTTVINHTIDDLLELAKKKKVIVLGPSTILSPALFEFGISALCGINVENHNHVLRHLSQGGSFRHLPGVRYATILR